MALYQKYELEISDLLSKMKSKNSEQEIQKLHKSLGIAVKGLVGERENTVRFDKLGYWTHSACHLFEKYSHGGTSMLQNEGILPLAEEIVDEMVEGVLKSKESASAKISCVDRLVGGILKYNIEKATPEKLQYQFLPASLKKPKFVCALKAGNSTPDIMNFIKSTAVSSVIEEIVRSAEFENIQRYVRPHKMIELLPALKLTAKERHRIAQVYNSERNAEDPDVLSEVISLKTAPFVKGVYIDVDNTLLNIYSDSVKLNENVHKYALEQLNKGRAVVIMTSGDIALKTTELISANVDKRLLPIVSKGELRGKKLETVVDDTDPLWQGFCARKYLHPDEIPGS